MAVDVMSDERILQYFKGARVDMNRKLTDVYEEGVLTVRQCQNWFAKFRSGNFDVEDAPRSGRPVEADKDVIKALVDANRRITIREIRLRLNLSNSTVYDHLKGLGLSSKLDVWVPHVLTERIASQTSRKLSVFEAHHHWGRKMGCIQQRQTQELLPDNTTINSEVYCHQLDKLNDALQQKRSELTNRKGVVFHQDNTRPHTSLVTREKFLQLEWEQDSKNEVATQSIVNKLVLCHDFTMAVNSHFQTSARKFEFCSASPEVETKRQHLQCITDIGSTLFLIPGILIAILTPISLIPMFILPLKYYIPLIAIFIASGIVAVLSLAVSGFLGNVVWYYDSEKKRMRPRLHCGTGPLRHFWGNGFYPGFQVLSPQEKVV
ncbi:mariner Mos1 transposase [Trichonephila clavipes]|nr:mariner Mos1 transposase [Trichonephila clavipes]